MNKIIISLLLFIFLASCVDDSGFINEAEVRYQKNRSSMANEVLDTNTNIANDSIKEYSLKTIFTNDWDNWEYKLEGKDGYFRTAFSNDFDNWMFAYDTLSGTIRTYTSEDWDYWELRSGNKHLKLKTYTSEDWDYWELFDTSATPVLKIKTYTSEDWDYWEVYNPNVKFWMKTSYSNDFDSWIIYDKQSGIGPLYKIAAMFVPVFTSAIKIQILNNKQTIQIP